MLLNTHDPSHRRVPPQSDIAQWPYAKLEGARILVVEDEAMLVLEIESALEDAGAEVVGPCMNLRQALQEVQDREIDAAILDVNLHGEDVFPVAERLFTRGIPFLFHTAHGERMELRARFENAPVCRKPILVEDLLTELAGIVP
ncbi:MAG: response regulator [Alphaproteobacteria bacterium]|nr:response regulator [Alphaproteobacteria bacterium]